MPNLIRTVNPAPPRYRVDLRGLDEATAKAIHDNSQALVASPSEYVKRLVALHANLRQTGHRAGIAFLCHENLATDTDLARARL